MTPEFCVVSRVELYDRIWSETMRKTAGEIGISLSDLRVTCQLYQIPTPSPSYWVLKGMGKQFTKPELSSSCPAGDLVEFMEGRPRLIVESIQSFRDKRASQLQAREHMLGCGILEKERGRAQGRDAAQFKRDCRRQAKEAARLDRLELNAFKRDCRRQAQETARLDRLELNAQQDSHIIQTIIAGHSMKEVSTIVGISSATLERICRMRLGLDADIIDRVFRARKHGKQYYTRHPGYSERATTIDRATKLQSWLKCVYRTAEAQRIPNPLDDVKAHLQGDMTEREYWAIFFELPQGFLDAEDPVIILNGIFWIDRNPSAKNTDFPDRFSDFARCQKWLATWKSAGIWEKIADVRNKAFIGGQEPNCTQF